MRGGGVKNYANVTDADNGLGKEERRAGGEDFEGENGLVLPAAEGGMGMRTPLAKAYGAGR